MRLKTLLLNKDDIFRIIRMKEVIDAVEYAFKEDGLKNAVMPNKVYIDTENGDFRAMPALVGKYAGIKWVNSHPDNYLKGIKSVMAKMAFL